MANDPLLSLSNLMRFDPDAEEGDFDLVVQVCVHHTGIVPLAVPLAVHEPYLKGTCPA